MNTTNLLFVYGTLRRGGSNDIARIAPSARFAGMARIRGRLYDLGAYPALLLDASDTAAGWVTGELYEIPDHEWPALDALEEPVTPQRPDGEYFKIITTVRADDGTPREVWAYSANPAVISLDREIGHGDWVVHVAARHIPD